MRDGANADVVMLNADAPKLARWIMDSCRFIGKNNNSCYENLLRSVIFASGAQFAVAGVVYEDLNGNGRSESYVFRDGVTVKVDSVGTGSESRLSAGQVRASLTEPVRFTYRFARIVSTTREQYYRYMAQIGVEPIDVGSSSPASARKNTWMDVIRWTYQQAWNSERNILMRAWAVSNRSRL